MNPKPDLSQPAQIEPEPPALGEAYAKALAMLPPDRQKAWAKKLTDSVSKDRKKTLLRGRTPRGGSGGSTNPDLLARPSV